jgi:hypothetical protein
MCNCNDNINSIQVSSGPAGPTGATGATGAGYGGTSTTSLAIGTGAKVFTTQSGMAYVVGSRVRAVSNSDVTKWMEGPCTAYAGTSLSINADLVSGVGTLADWNLSLAGERGQTGLTGAQGIQGVAGPTGATGPTGPAANDWTIVRVITPTDLDAQVDTVMLTASTDGTVAFILMLEFDSDTAVNITTEILINGVSDSLYTSVLTLPPLIGGTTRGQITTPGLVPINSGQTLTSRVTASNYAGDTNIRHMKFMYYYQ